MTPGAPAAVTLKADPLGSHFVLPDIADDGLRSAFERLPHAGRSAGSSIWRAPAIPRVGEALRRLLLVCPKLELSPAAQALLDRLGGVPAGANTVAAPCEHRPGVVGVIIAGAPEAALRAALDRLPERRYDADLDRWWLPARDAPKRALAQLLSQDRRLAATLELRLELDRFEHQMELSPNAVAGLTHRCVVAVEEASPESPRLRLCRLCNPDLAPALRELGLEFRRSYESWYVTIETVAAPSLRALLDACPGLAAADGVTATLDEAVRVAGRLEDMERLSVGHDGDVSVAGVAAPLRPFQAAAVEYARRARRTFLADEPGLGKTVQALATLQAETAFPALVVCPASLRLNWQREAERWLPSRTAYVLRGDEAHRAADITIVSYDLLHRVDHAELTAALRALVFDESHFLKNPSSRRTRAAQALADAVDPSSLVLLLTGTPIVNRPAELGSQLRVLGRLDVVGGARRLARVYGKGRELDALNRRLRRTCYVRRAKSEVLPQLPAKQRVVVPVELSNRAEYAQVRNDVASWVRAQAEADAHFVVSIQQLEPAEREAAVRARGREAAQRARRAEALVRLTKLSLVAARGKLDDANEWIDAFTDGDEKLVVFCRHREIGSALHSAHPGAALATGELTPDGRSQEVERFQQDPACRLIVCSLAAAGVGLTLTAASNVAFVEMGWSPATQDQAEDRVHRIGQQWAVTAWYFLAADTIDERIASVVDRKRLLVSAASDGRPIDHAPLVDELLNWVADQRGGDGP